MVQLNTTYDSKLKGKVFVLKGEEAYARTTDTVAELISDFGDCNTHFSYTRVGLQIRVLRAIGDGLITIYIDGNEQEPIPYNPDNMEELINDSGFNDKGIYWNDGWLVIGHPSNSDTGYHVDYDTEHSIKVVYSSDSKQCLGSESETILFEHERPDTLVSSLSFGSTPTYVDSVYPTGVASIEGTIELVCDYDVQDEKRNVYLIIDDLGIRELVKVYPNTPTSFTITGVSEGLQSIRAVFDGDYEILDCTETLDVSVGCKVSVMSEAPSPVINNESTHYNISARDYFGNPVNGTVSPVYCQSISEEIHGAKRIFLTKSNYSQMIGQNPNIASNIIDMTTLFTKSETAKYLNVPIGSEDAYGLEYYDNVNVAVSYDDIIGLGRTTPITLSFTTNGSPLPNHSCYVRMNGTDRTITSNQNGKATFNYRGTGAGEVTIATNRPVHSETVMDYDRYWSRSPNIKVNYDFNTENATLFNSTGKYVLQCDEDDSIGFLKIPVEASKYQIEFYVHSFGSIPSYQSGSIFLSRGNGITVSAGSIVTVTKEYVSSENKTYLTLSDGVSNANIVLNGDSQIPIGVIASDYELNFNNFKGWVVE